MTTQTGFGGPALYLRAHSTEKISTGSARPLMGTMPRGRREMEWGPWENGERES